MLLYTSTLFYYHGETHSRHKSSLSCLLGSSSNQSRENDATSFLPSFHQSEQLVSELLTNQNLLWCRVSCQAQGYSLECYGHTHIHKRTSYWVSARLRGVLFSQILLVDGPDFLEKSHEASFSGRSLGTKKTWFFFSVWERWRESVWV